MALMFVYFIFIHYLVPLSLSIFSSRLSSFDLNFSFEFIRLHSPIFLFSFIYQYSYFHPFAIIPYFIHSIRFRFSISSSLFRISLHFSFDLFDTSIIPTSLIIIRFRFISFPLTSSLPHLILYLISTPTLDQNHMYSFYLQDHLLAGFTSARLGSSSSGTKQSLASNKSANSPLLAMDITMSQPPTNSLFT